jgi:transposase-like protein
VLDLVVQRRRDTEAALKLLKRLLRNQLVDPEIIVTDGLASYASALTALGLSTSHAADAAIRSFAASRLALGVIARPAHVRIEHLSLAIGSRL